MAPEKRRKMSQIWVIQILQHNLGMETDFDRLDAMTIDQLESMRDRLVAAYNRKMREES